MKVFVPNNASSNIFRISHSNIDRPNESKEGDLIVGMKGGTYVYEGVPIEHMVELIRSESAGKYLNGVIKPNYYVRKAKDEEASALELAEPLVFDETQYLLLFPANAQHLERSLQQARSGEAKVRELLDPGMILPHQNNWGQPVDLKFLDPNVTVKYAKDGDAAFDLMASRVANPVTDWALEFPIHLEPGQHVLIGTGIAMKLPIGLAGLVTPRSGLAKKLRVSVVNTPGLIDSGYTGEIGALVENRGDETYVINQYDRIAQYLIVPAITPIFRVVDELDQTERGANGFGSTGTEKVVL